MGFFSEVCLVTQVVWVILVFVMTTTANNFYAPYLDCHLDTGMKMSGVFKWTEKGVLLGLVANLKTPTVVLRNQWPHQDSRHPMCQTEAHSCLFFGLGCGWVWAERSLLIPT